MHIGCGDRVWNRPFSQLSDHHDLDLRSGHMAYSCVSVTDLYLDTKFRLNWKSFCGQTDVETGFIMLTRSRPKKEINQNRRKTDIVDEWQGMSIAQCVCVSFNILLPRCKRLCQLLKPKDYYTVALARYKSVHSRFSWQMSVYKHLLLTTFRSSAVLHGIFLFPSYQQLISRKANTTVIKLANTSQCCYVVNCRLWFSIPGQSADCGIHFPRSTHEPTGQAHDDEPGNELHSWTTSSHCTPGQHYIITTMIQMCHGHWMMHPGERLLY